MTEQTPSASRPKLWHCYNSRSLRPLWALEEMGIDYDLEVMLFPPRYRHDGYKDVNVLGTVRGNCWAFLTGTRRKSRTIWPA